MRLVRTCFCLILCATSTLASSSADESPSSTELLRTLNETTTTTNETIEATVEPEITSITPIASSISSPATVREEETVSEEISSTLATSTSSTSSYETPTISSSYTIPPSIPSEPPASPSTSLSSLSSTSSPLSPSPDPTSLSILPLPSVSIVSELPLTSVPPVPEFLSFNEWKEKYVVVPDPSIALARRAKKAAQRQRQDVVGAGSVGDKGATYDGDGTDLGSLFAPGEENVSGESTVGSQSDSGRRDERRRRTPKDELPTPPESAAASSTSLSPIQPLSNVGTGDENDPLLPLKDRSNYAAFECAAMVHRSSRKTKGASSILVEKKDRYMLTPCSADPKFVEVELCDEIQIDTIVLANFEFFSSMFKHFKASCSVNYPGAPDEWHDLGTFRARNVRGVQVFRPRAIPNFCRYIRINFLSHFGSEYYCPVSLLRVYGYTQLDAYRESERKARQIQEALAAAEEYVEDEGDELDYEVEGQLEVPVQTIEVKTETESVEGRNDSIIGEESQEPTIDSSSPTPTAISPSPSAPSLTSTVVQQVSSALQATSVIPLENPESSPAPTPFTSDSVSTQDGPRSSTSAPQTSAMSTIDTSGENASTTSTTVNSESSPNISSPTDNPPSTSSVSPTPSKPMDSSSLPTQSASPASSSSSSSARPATPSDLPIINPRPGVAPRNDTPSSHTYSQPHYHQPHRSPVLPPPVQQPQPGESIYGTIMKRLTSLEHNQTLSMHFIEAQSSMLREAFLRIERRLSEVEAMRSRQEQGIRQALLDLEKERTDLERERSGLTTQVGMLSQEIRFEKRLSVVQLVGTLLLIIFVGFTRSIPTSPFLHLAAGSRSERRAIAKRDGEPKEEQEKLEAEEKSSPDISRKPLTRRSSGNGGSRNVNGHSKRYPSISKSVPRRHYGTGTSSSSRTPAFAKSPRAWTPPIRHSSAPPEEAFVASVSTALEGKEPRRRNGSNRRPGSPFEFPRRSKLDNELGLAIEPILSRPAHSTSSTLPNPLPSFLASDSRQSTGLVSSNAEDADTEPSDSGRQFELSSNGDFDHYTTTDDEDDLSHPSLPPIIAPIPSSPVRTAGIRPPKPDIPSRPASSSGIPFPSKPSFSHSDSSFRRSPKRNVPTPPSTVPSPPPEPVAEDSTIKLRT